MKTKTIKGYFDLDYVVLIDVPVKSSKHGPVIDLDPTFIERRISEELVRQRVPLRGREMTFLRKALGLSLEKFGNSFGYTGSGVLKWERDPDKRLDPLTEAAMRSYFAEKLGIKLSGWFNELVGKNHCPESLEVKTGRAA